MEGGSSLESAGMIPRAIYQIFDTAKTLEQKGWSYEFEGSFLEIYNETIRDLLSSTAGKKEAKLDIKHAGDKTNVTDLTSINLTSKEDVQKVLDRARSNRSVGVTNMNERSSRSHRYIPGLLTRI